MNAPEEINHIVANRRAIRCGYVAEEIDDIMVRLAIDADAPKKNNNVAVHRTFDIHAAEKADGVMDCIAGGNVNCATKLNHVLGSVSWNADRQREENGTQTSMENSSVQK
jgi:hypothetical protein